MENFAPPQVLRIKDTTINFACQIFQTVASLVIHFVKIIADHLVGQKFFVVGVDVAEERAGGINCAEIFRRQMFADAVASVEFRRIKFRQPNIFATRAATIAIKFQRESARLSVDSPCPTALQNSFDARFRKRPLERKNLRRKIRRRSK